MKDIITTIVAIALTLSLSAQQKVEKWYRYEISLKGTPIRNPFGDVVLDATFTNGDKSVTVSGFYDGASIYKVRFMPDQIGKWSFTTKSNMPALNGKTGTFECVAPSKNNHGFVETRGKFDFQYSDGTPYYPFGTTVYALIHQDKNLESQTLRTLATAPFNKVRICAFPKNYAFNDVEPPYYPFKKIDGVELVESNKTAVWDFSKFNPQFFQHLEQAVDSLADMGIECDLILFHPYDKGRWGFDRMTRDTDIKYIKYITARLGAFRNVWWSLANEFDYMEAKTDEDWNAILESVAANNTYSHPISIHNGDSLFNHNNQLLTHASIQTASMLSDFGRASLMRDAYHKPVIFDEVCYEGDFEQRWGNLSAEEMVHRFWQGVITGSYVTHGETFQSDDQVVWWARGGVLKGKSPERIKFLRDLIETETGAFHIVDNWRNLNTSIAESGQILVYFGKETPKEWVFSLPKKCQFADGTKLKIEIIDTWNMTRTTVNDTFTTKELSRYIIGEQNGKKVKLPSKPNIALLISLEK